MSEDEKKAVEYWKGYMEILHWNIQLASEHHMKVLLDLIEKQQKELEQEKEKNKELLNSKIGVDLSYDDYVSKDKIRKFIKNETYEGTYNVILSKRLKELLEEE